MNPLPTFRFDLFMMLKSRFTAPVSAILGWAFATATLERIVAVHCNRRKVNPTSY
jgi:hypothetical protein